MEQNQFEDTWPGFTEGEGRADRAKLLLLEQERKALPDGKWVWLGVPIAMGIARFSGGSWAVAFGCAGLVIAFEVTDLLRRSLAASLAIKVEIEYLKGSIRENRWIAVTNRDALFDTRHRPNDVN